MFVSNIFDKNEQTLGLFQCVLLHKPKDYVFENTGNGHSETAIYTESKYDNDYQIWHNWIENNSNWYPDTIGDRRSQSLPESLKSCEAGIKVCKEEKCPIITSQTHSVVHSDT